MTEKRFLPEQRAFAALTVIGYQLFYGIPCAAEIFCKTIDTYKFIRSSENKLSENSNIIIKKRSGAFLAGFVICHYAFTIFARYIIQSCEGI